VGLANPDGFILEHRSPSDSRLHGNPVNPKLEAHREHDRHEDCLGFPACHGGVGRDTVTRLASAVRGIESVISTPHHVLWLGSSEAPDLDLARAAVARLATIHVFESAAAALASPPEPIRSRSPAVIVLASSSPGRWTLGDAIAVSLRWPLSPLVSVASTIVDGRRRSGPPVSGVDEVMWYDLPGRLRAWLDDREHGRPGTRGLPSTARREEAIVETVRPRVSGLGISIAAGRPADLDALADLSAAAGASVIRRTCGRPPFDDDSAVLAWDVGAIDSPSLEWLRMLSANRPWRRIIVLESFPRAETTQAALEAGASAVLGRPCGVESLAGTLLVVGSPA
jgi:hypothetical protein